MKKKIWTISIISMFLLVSVSSFIACAADDNEEDPVEPNPDQDIIILGGRGLRVYSKGLSIGNDDHVKLVYDYKRLGHKEKTYPVVGTGNANIRITNFQFDSGSYSVTASIGGMTKTKSGFYILGFFL